MFAELLSKIENCNSVADCDLLRLDVVRAKDQEVLKAWQDKYWSLKLCPTCGRSL
jgi:DNA/RNA-binding domain of Phe-tRNA-synthetase-like protein